MYQAQTTYGTLVCFVEEGHKKAHFKETRRWPWNVNVWDGKTVSWSVNQPILSDFFCDAWIPSLKYVAKKMFYLIQ